MSPQDANHEFDVDEAYFIVPYHVGDAFKKVASGMSGQKEWEEISALKQKALGMSYPETADSINKRIEIRKQRLGAITNLYPYDPSRHCS